jgi:hypothetical protein
MSRSSPTVKAYSCSSYRCIVGARENTCSFVSSAHFSSVQLIRQFVWLWVGMFFLVGSNHGLVTVLYSTG